MTQEGYLGEQALGKAGLVLGISGNWILGKSVVAANCPGDRKENIDPHHPGSILLTRVNGFEPWSPVPFQRVNAELGGPWMFYQRFWIAHNSEEYRGIGSRFRHYS